MFKIFRKELDWGDTRLVLETGKVARQADGAVMVSLGETTVLCTAVAAQTAKPGQDFFPLTVNYQEKAFAAGKIPGGFFKREGRPSENETLVSRLIDRPIRPLFPKSFKCETQVICTVLAHDMENNPDIAAMIGASAALTLSGVPFFGPIAAARVGWINDAYVLNPTVEQMERTALPGVAWAVADGDAVTTGASGTADGTQSGNSLQIAYAGLASSSCSAICATLRRPCCSAWQAISCSNAKECSHYLPFSLQLTDEAQIAELMRKACF